jgi:hypothetical protein
MRRWIVYGLTGLCLVAGPAVLLFAPWSSTLNLLVGGALVGGAVAGVWYMIVAFDGPDERGPDF